MSDLISRQAAIDALADQLYHSAEDYRTAVKVIGNLPSAQPQYIARDIATIIENEKDMRVVLKQPRWIPCSERLPENEDIYLVTFDKSNLLDNETQVTDAYWINNQWQYGVLESYEHRMPKLVIEPIEELKVIAWMPFPEPYKGEES